MVFKHFYCCLNEAILHSSAFDMCIIKTQYKQNLVYKQCAHKVNIANQSKKQNIVSA